MVIYFNAPACLDTYVLKAIALDIGTTARAEQNLVPDYTHRLPVRIDEEYFTTLYLANLAAEVKLHAFLGVDAAKHGGLFRIHASQNLRKHLHDGHLGAKTVEETCELHSNHAAAYYYKAFRTLTQ